MRIVMPVKARVRWMRSIDKHSFCFWMESHFRTMNGLKTIQRNVLLLRESLPSGVMLVAATKTRTADEVNTAVDAGIEAIGYNYVHEAQFRAYYKFFLLRFFYIVRHLRRTARKVSQMYDRSSAFRVNDNRCVRMVLM